MLVSNLAAQRLADDPEGSGSTGAGHEITTKRRLCHQRTCGLRTRKYRPCVLERLRAAATTRRWRRRLLHRGHLFASSVLMDPISREFVARFDRFARQQRVPVVQFRKGERKDDVAAEYLKKFQG
jgi:hypothetical protein